jgi:cytidylate kinase
MAQEHESARTMQIVTISREYGSGGGEIAARLARQLGWRLVDHEVVAQVAQALGVSEAEAESHDEHVDSLAMRLLSGLSIVQTPIPIGVPVPLDIDSDSYDQARRAAVLGAAATGQVVIVGRGAQVLLAGRPDVLHVRIIAPLDARIAYVMRREKLDHPAAAARIGHKDQDRVHFLQGVHQRNPTDAHLYDLVVNTGAIPLDQVVDLLVGALEGKARVLALPEAERGPGTGLGSYPQPPADGRPGPA